MRHGASAAHQAACKGPDNERDAKSRDGPFLDERLYGTNGFLGAMSSLGSRGTGALLGLLSGSSGTVDRVMGSCSRSRSR